MDFLEPLFCRSYEFWRRRPWTMRLLACFALAWFFAWALHASAPALDQVLAVSGFWIWLTAPSLAGMVVGLELTRWPKRNIG